MATLRHRIAAGNTLLIKGPASVRLVEGDAEIFHYRMERRRGVLARPWRSLPVHALSDAEVEVELGSDAWTKEVEGDTVPGSWRGLAESLGGSFRVMTLGGVDAGKTALSVYLYNAALERVREVSLAELDTGQAEVCPPTTMGIAFGAKQVPDLSLLRAGIIYPFGYTSPSYSVRRAVETAAALAGDLRGEAVIIDPDGWIGSGPADRYKAELIRVLRPTHVALLGIEAGGAVSEAAEDMGAEFVRLEAPGAVTRRDSEARRRIREMNYTRFLRDSAIRSIPTSWLTITPLIDEDDEVGRDYLVFLRSMIMDVERCGCSAAARLLQAEGLDLSRAGMGAISYLYSPEGAFVGLGLFMGIDERRQIARIYTPHRGAVREVKIGSLILSTSFEELHVFRGPHNAQPTLHDL